MYKRLENFSIKHSSKVDFHEFNKRILRTIENLSITEVVSNGFFYEIDQKTDRGIHITYFPEKIEISIFPLSSKYDYKLADVLVNYLVFYSNGFFPDNSPKSKFNLLYDDGIENDNQIHSIAPKTLGNINSKIPKG